MLKMGISINVKAKVIGKTSIRLLKFALNLKPFKKKSLLKNERQKLQLKF